MITIVLMNKDGKFLEEVWAFGNEHYLLLLEHDNPKYPLISELTDCSTDVFSSERMPQLIVELESFKANLTEEQKTHINDIIRLAKICEVNKGYTLGFTPFIH